MLLLQTLTTSPERRVDVGEVSAFTDRAHIALATSLAETAAAPHEWVGLGRLDLGPLVLVLANGPADFARLSRGRLPAWSAGATFAGSRTIMIRLDAGDPYQTLMHELAHVALHHAVTERVPLWFDEGYAVVAAQEFGRFDQLRLNIAVVTGHVPDLRQLDGALRSSEDEAGKAYALAGSAVSEVARLSRNSQLAEFMTLLRAGVPFDDAIDRGTGYPIGRFEVEWMQSVRTHNNWLVWLAAGGMWLIVTLVLSWAAATRKHREAPRRAALDVGWPEPPEDDETITIQQVGPSST